MKPSADKLQVIVITGASDGLGAELAVQLAARHGSNLALVLAARNLQRLQMVARTCKRFGAVCLIVRTNVASETECKHLIRTAAEQFGGIDILINNAGRNAYAELAECHDLSWHQELMRVNYWGSVWCTHAALPYLQESQGKILSIVSHASLTGSAGNSAYSASKAALSAFFDCLRDELRGSGISVLTAYPSEVASRFSEHAYQTGNVTESAASSALPVSESASRILRGLEKNQSRIMLRFRDRLTHSLHLLIPGISAKLRALTRRPADTSSQQNSLHPNM